MSRRQRTSWDKAQEAQDRLVMQAQREEAIDRARRGILAFTLFTKPGYKVNWHHRFLAEKLNRLVRGDIRRLMVFMPPRHGKSELVSRRLPAFIHGVDPDAEIMAASYNLSLAKDMTADVQRIMDSDEYRELFSGTQVTPDGRVTQWARNSEEHEVMFRLGKYRGQGVGGTFTGRGARYIIVDDPVKNHEEAESAAYRDHVWKFYQSALSNRIEADGRILITMTRWHWDDLAGRLLALSKSDPNADQWEVVDFPAIRDTLDNRDDPRELGQALWPQNYSEERLRNFKATMGSRYFTSLYQQRPSSTEGNEVKRTWFKYYRELPGRIDEKIQSWDMAFKESKTSDFVVGQVWARAGSNKYLVAQYRARTDIIGTLTAFENMTRAHKDAMLKLVEDKANGPAVMGMLKGRIPGIVEVEPSGSKIARLRAVAPQIEAGNVWLPHPDIAPWIGEYIDEMVDFPGAHDDQVDATTQALLRFQQTEASMFTEEMAKPRGQPMARFKGQSW